LNADVVLTGQLQQNGNMYSLTCQLVDAADQSQVWGTTFKMKADDISRIEDSIVSSLMNPLRITLVDKSKGIQQNKPVNPQAYAEYMKGRFLSYGSTPKRRKKHCLISGKPSALIRNMQQLMQLLPMKKLYRVFFQQLLKKK
jgi:hypothetical protein